MTANELTAADVATQLATSGYPIGSSAVATWAIGKNLPKVEAVTALADVFNVPLRTVIAIIGKPPHATIAKRMAIDPDGAFPNVLRSWADNLGLRPGHMPDLMGLSRWEWSRWVAGSSVPSRGLLLRIAEGTGLGLEMLAASLRPHPDRPTDLDSWAARVVVAPCPQMRRTRLAWGDTIVEVAARTGWSLWSDYEQGRKEFTPDVLVALRQIVRFPLGEALRAVGVSPKDAANICRLVNRPTADPARLLTAGGKLRTQRMAINGDHCRKVLRPDHTGLPMHIVAGHLGVHRRRTIKFENGETAPSIVEVLRLSEVLQLEPADLYRSYGFAA